MEEQWKEIDGYPHYEVSNLGNVRSYLCRKVIATEFREYSITSVCNGKRKSTYGYVWKFGHPTYSEYLAQLNN